MASSIFSLLLLPFLFSLAFADNISPTTPVSPSTICNSTPDPSYCKSVVSTSNNNQTIYNYGRISVTKSLFQARAFMSRINNYLTRKSTLSISTIRALEDCKFLTELNIDFLLNSIQTINSTSNILPFSKAEDIQTLLSAVLTNELTCLDGLQSTSSALPIKNGLSSSINNDTKMHSVSLALFTKGWVPNRKNSNSNSNPNQKIRNGRKLLQSSGGSVLVSDKVTVSLDGTGNFTTINEAIGIAPNNSNGSKGYFVIYVTAGVYEEYVSIAKNKRNFMMIGDGINKTIITGNRSVVDGWTTFNSATFAVVSPNFVMKNITIRNTAGAIKHQAVALRSGADLSSFYSCSFEGYQDTLYSHSLRQFYKNCDIYGTVDFIFGNAAVVLQNCSIYPRLPMSGQFNAITAQGRTDPNQNTGTSIHGCNIRPADDLASSSSSVRTYLGRPWKEYSRTVYMKSFMDSFIDSAGWRAWDGDFALSTLFYAEFGNTGAGSTTAGRVTWPGYHVINATDAGNFTVSNFLLGDDWLPPTAVPYAGGLFS